MSDPVACNPRDLDAAGVKAMIYGQLGLALLAYFFTLIHGLIHRILCRCGACSVADDQAEAGDWQELTKWHSEVARFEAEARTKLASADGAPRWLLDGVHAELRQRAVNLGEKQSDLEDEDAYETFMDRVLGNIAGFITTNSIQPRQEWKENLKVWRGAKTCKFLWHVRTQANFIRNNIDPLLIRPPISTPEACSPSFTHYALYRCICRARTFVATLTGSCTYALLAGAVGSHLWLMKYEAAIGARPEASVAWIDDAATSFGAMSGDFRFFPAFLLFGCGICKFVDRYMAYNRNLHALQANIHNLAVMVGGGLRTAKDPVTRKLVFRIYRYLNMIHALCYSSVNKALPHTLHEYQRLGLLTRVEVADLLPMENKVRDTVTGWLSAAVKGLQARGALDSMTVDWDAVSQIRGACAEHHDLFQQNLPSLWISIMRLAIDILLVMETVGMPFRSLTFNRISLCAGGDSMVFMSFQSTTVFGVFFISFAFMAAFDVVRLLSNPFTGRVDVLNTTAVLCDTEQVIFGSLRCQFTETRFFNEDEDVFSIYDGEDQAGIEAPNPDSKLNPIWVAGYENWAEEGATSGPGPLATTPGVHVGLGGPRKTFEFTYSPSGSPRSPSGSKADDAPLLASPPALGPGRTPLHKTMIKKNAALVKIACPTPLHPGASGGQDDLKAPADHPLPRLSTTQPLPTPPMDLGEAQFWLPRHRRSLCDSDYTGTPMTTPGQSPGPPIATDSLRWIRWIRIATPLQAP